MKLRLLWLGKTKDPHLAALAADYASRIEHFLPLEISELRDPKASEERRRDVEGEKLLAALDPNERIILLDAGGKSWNSSQFAEFVARHMRDDSRKLTFVIGGHSGVSDGVRRRADLTVSLSPMTFTHDLARLLLLEQIYRALTIIHHHPYSR